MRCLAMVAGAFESPDLGAPSRYLKYILLTLEKFLEVSEVEEVIQKMRKFQIKFRNFEMNL